MKIKLDENLPERLVAALAALDHDIDTVRAERLKGQPDPSVWSATQTAQRFFITKTSTSRICAGTRPALTPVCSSYD